MSPHVGNFVQDLVEMAKAMDELPQVKANLAEANEFLEMERQTVQDRELAILRYKQEIDDLQSALRNAEVARDDAELRFLSLEETAHMVRRILNDISSSAQNQARQLTAAIEPQPLLQPEVTPQGSSEAPLSGESAHSPEQSASALPVSATIFDEGQSEPDPTSEMPSAINPADVTALDAAPSQDSASGAHAEPNPGLYSGLNHFDFPSYIPYDAWIAGGGTEADYWHRRDEQLTA